MVFTIIVRKKMFIPSFRVFFNFYSYMLPAHRLISRCNSYCSVRSVRFTTDDCNTFIERENLFRCSRISNNCKLSRTIRNRIDKNCIQIRIKSLFSQLKQRDRNRLFTLRTFKGGQIEGKFPLVYL